MTQGEYIRLKAQIAILREVAMDYSGKTIENIIQQLESRTKEADKVYGKQDSKETDEIRNS